MTGLLRWLFVIPFALLMAATAGALSLFVASVVDPTMAALVGHGLQAGLSALTESLFAADDPAPVMEAAATGFGRLAFAVLVLPPLAVGLGSEIARLRQPLWYAGATGMLTAAVPFLLRGVTARGATAAELHVSVVLGLAGAAAGLVYWMVAGRGAGAERRAEPVPTI
ncbi:MAG TPA: hypothetical protein VIL09_01560 [Microvirga sp.]|jgi:hypothetical protein